MKRFLLMIVGCAIICMIYYFLDNFNFEKTEYQGSHLIKRYHIKRGMLNGKYEELDSIGQTILECNFIDDKQEGFLRTYYWNGKINKEVFFRNGIQEDSVRFYYPNGRLLESGYVLHGKREGRFKSFFEDGSTRQQGKFLNGFKDSTWISFDSLRRETITYYHLDTVLYEYFNNRLIDNRVQLSIELDGDWVAMLNGANFVSFQPANTSFAFSISCIIEKTDLKSIDEIVDKSILNAKSKIEFLKIIKTEFETNLNKRLLKLSGQKSGMQMQSNIYYYFQGKNCVIFNFTYSSSKPEPLVETRISNIIRKLKIDERFVWNDTR